MKLMQGLSDFDRKILTFARHWWSSRGAQEQAVRDAFDIPLTHYYQHLARIIELPGALAFDPFTVRRLQRIRDRQKWTRTA